MLCISPLIPATVTPLSVQLDLVFLKVFSNPHDSIILSSTQWESRSALQPGESTMHGLLGCKMHLQTREEYFIGRHLLTAKLWKAPGKGKVFGSVHSLPKASGETRGEELNEKCWDSLFHAVFFCIYHFNFVHEGQIMSCLSFVINIVSG